MVSVQADSGSRSSLSDEYRIRPAASCFTFERPVAASSSAVGLVRGGRVDPAGEIDRQDAAVPRESRGRVGGGRVAREIGGLEDRRGGVRAGERVHRRADQGRVQRVAEAPRRGGGAMEDGLIHAEVGHDAVHPVGEGEDVVAVRRVEDEPGVDLLEVRAAGVVLGRAAPAASAPDHQRHARHSEGPTDSTHPPRLRGRRGIGLGFFGNLNARPLQVKLAAQRARRVGRGHLDGADGAGLAAVPAGVEGQLALLRRGSSARRRRGRGRWRGRRRPPCGCGRPPRAGRRRDAGRCGTRRVQGPRRSGGRPFSRGSWGVS